jgi:hypothetical protein
VCSPLTTQTSVCKFYERIIGSTRRLKPVSRSGFISLLYVQAYKRVRPLFVCNLNFFGRQYMILNHPNVQNAVGFTWGWDNKRITSFGKKNLLHHPILLPVVLKYVNIYAYVPYLLHLNLCKRRCTPAPAAGNPLHEVVF